MHPTEYASDLFAAVVLILAGYHFHSWAAWSLGLGMLILAVTGLHQAGPMLLKNAAHSFAAWIVKRHSRGNK